jgi:hypothetical protein
MQDDPGKRVMSTMQEHLIVPFLQQRSLHDLSEDVVTLMEKAALAYRILAELQPEILNEHVRWYR